MKTGTDFLPEPPLPTITSSQELPVHNCHHHNQHGDPAGGHSSGNGFAIHWQDGPTGEAGGRNGAFVEEVIEAVISRLQAFQASRFAHPANAEAIMLLEDANTHLNERTAERKSRGVEGRNIE